MNTTLRVVEAALKIMPRWMINGFIEVVFPLVSLGMGKLRQICVRNLQLVYGDSKDQRECESISNQLIKSIGYSMMDLMYYVDRPEQLSKIVSLEYEDHLKEALKLGKGVIAVSAHMGNFPLMFVSLVQRGYKINVVIRNMRDEDFSIFMHRMCARWGINMIPTSPGKRFLKESLDALKRNELLFILLDEAVAPKDGVKVKFLNSEVTRATGPMLFLKRTDSPIVPFFIVQDEQKHYKIFIEEPYEVYRGGDGPENVTKNIMGLNQIIERFVSRYPFQWGGWFNKRWAA